MGDSSPLHLKGLIMICRECWEVSYRSSFSLNLKSCVYAFLIGLTCGWLLNLCMHVYFICDLRFLLIIYWEIWSWHFKCNFISWTLLWGCKGCNSFVVIAGTLCSTIISLTQLLIVRWNILWNISYLIFCVFNMVMMILVNNIRKEIKEKMQTHEERQEEEDEETHAGLYIIDVENL